MKRQTCDKFLHYTPPEHTGPGTAYAYDGRCALMVDSNDVEEREPDKCYGWDYKGYRAGVYVGPKFGCIHWEKKETK